MMTWLKDTEPFEQKDTITRKRIQQGLTPEKRKYRDAKHLRRQFRTWGQYWWAASQSRPPHEQPFYFSPNGMPYVIWGGRTHFHSSWTRTYIDKRYPPGNHSNRQRMRM